MKKALNSPLLMARSGGVLYLIIIIAALFAEMYARSTLVVSGDAARTAVNILESERMFRFGGGAQLITVLCDITLSVILFEIMKPVSRIISLLSSSFRFAAIIVIAVTTVSHFAPLTILDQSYLYGFTDEQRQALSYLSFAYHSIGYNIALLLFGVHCILLGYLIARSAFLPALIGLLMVLAGFGYAANSFAFFVHPALATWSFPILMPLAFIAEGALALWLTIVGVNTKRWLTQSANN